MQHKAAKLEIKKDPKGVVTVPGATVVDNISSARELMDVIEAGLARRRVSSTQVQTGADSQQGRRGVGRAATSGPALLPGTPTAAACPPASRTCPPSHHPPRPACLHARPPPGR